MKILVVDDEPPVLKLFQDALSRVENIQIHAAITAERALEIAREAGGIEILFTDVVLPGMDGFTLHQKLDSEFPGLSTVFISGYDLSAYETYTKSHHVLQKPFSLDGLVDLTNQIIHERLSRPAPAPPVAAVPLPTESQLLNASPDARSRSASLRSLVQRQGFTGKLDQFQLVDIIQMCCLSRRSGRLQITKGIESGVLFLNTGDIIHAVTGNLTGEQAVYKIIGWDFGQFSFEDGLEPDTATISSGWEHLIMEAVRLRDEKGANTPPEKAEGLVGQTLGQYRILRKIGEGEWGETFEAIQTSMERPVALKVLWKDLGDDSNALQEFIASASAKANVAHPYILSVYEAGEADGRYFYARELVDGSTLKDLKAEGKIIDDATALVIIRTCAEALSYLNANKIPHADLTEESIYLDSEKRPRLANLANPASELKTSPQGEIRALSKFVGSAMQGGAAATPGFRTLLTRMLIEGTGGFPSFGALIQAAKALEPKVIPQDAYKITEQDRKAIEAVERAKKMQKRAMIYSSVVIMALIWVAIAVFYFRFVKPVSQKSFSNIVEVPAGEFIYQENEKKNLPVFYIDEYEVSIGQYARFLEDMEKNPTTIYNHPDAPAGINFKPSGWDVYYKSAVGDFSRSTFKNAPIDLNHPVMLLNWYAAYAYAKWRGGRLPTEEEWEKAARGTEGNKFPWGNEMITKGVNTNSDYVAADASKKGKIDGHNRWAPVDAMKKDLSPFGVYGMAGNVSEWTDSKAKSSNGEMVPVIRGGNYASNDYDLKRRILEMSEFGTSERIGFRVVYDTPPEDVKVIKK